MRPAKYKVLHLPTTVGGNPQGLSRHFCELGVHSESWTISQNYLSYAADRVITKSTDSRVLAELKKLWALTYVFRFQVIFFNYGRTLFMPFPSVPNHKRHWIKRPLLTLYQSYSSVMHRLEIFSLSALNRIVLVQYQGDDARQGDYCRAHFQITAATQVDDSYYTPENDALKRERISSLTRLCAKTYSLNPDLLYVLPDSAEFLPYSHISLTDWPPHYTQLADRPLRIGHAPSHWGAKGTRLILDAVDTLRQHGFEFEFLLIEGLSNAEAKERYKTIDVLVDQLFIGWYGGLAVEAMALGKPVIAYIRNNDLRFIPAQMQQDLPIVQAEPNTIYQRLKQVLAMPRGDLLELAKRSRAYVEKWHDPAAIAMRIKTDIDNTLRKK